MGSRERRLKLQRKRNKNLIMRTIHQKPGVGRKKKVQPFLQTVEALPVISKITRVVAVHCSANSCTDIVVLQTSVGGKDYEFNVQCNECHCNLYPEYLQNNTSLPTPTKDNHTKEVCNSALGIVDVGINLILNGDTLKDLTTLKPLETISDVDTTFSNIGDVLDTSILKSEPIMSSISKPKYPYKRKLPAGKGGKFSDGNSRIKKIMALRQRELNPSKTFQELAVSLKLNKFQSHMKGNMKNTK